MKKISEDLRVGIVEDEDTTVLAFVVSEGYRTSQNLNLVNDEIRELYECLKEHFEEAKP